MGPNWSFKIFVVACLVLSPCAICEEVIDNELEKNLLGAVDPELIEQREQIRLELEKHQPKPIEKTPEMTKEIDDMKGLLMQSSVNSNLNLGKKMTQMMNTENKNKAKDQILKNTIMKENRDNETENPELEPKITINVIDTHTYTDDEDQNKHSLFKKRFPLNKTSHDLHHFTSSQEEFKNLYRDQLQIQSVQENIRFKSGTNVLQWKTIVNGGKTFVVGRRVDSLILLQEDGDNSFKESQVLLYTKNESFPRTLDSFKVWDDPTASMLNIIVVATEYKLLWYQLKNEFLDPIWSITLHSQISATLQFHFNQKNVLVLTTTDGQARFYQFELPTKQFWMTQMLHLEVPTTGMTALEAGQDFMVAFVQNSSVSVYKYNNLHFEHLRDIRATNVTSISGFRIGSHSYLAVGGDEPQILRYLKGKFVLQTIFSKAFGFVEAFLPITARTYRDDLILLVQHRIEYPTHSYSTLEALIWNGLAFHAANSVVCHIADLSEPFGLNCVLDYENEEGLSGATFIKSGKNISLLVPRHEAPSGLFEINYKIVPTEDPIEKELIELQNSYDLIIEMLEHEDEVLSVAEAALQNTMDPYESQFFEDIQELFEVETNFLELDNVQIESDVIELLNGKWTKFDSLVDLKKLEETMDEDEKVLDALEAQLSVLIRKNRQSHLPDSRVTNLGNPFINGQLNPKSAIKMEKSNQRNPRQLTVPKTLKLRHLDVTNLFFERVNGVPASELVFLKNETLSIPLERLTISNLKAKDVDLFNDGTVNKLDISKDVVTLESGNFPTTLNIPDVVIARSLNVKEINNLSVLQPNMIPNTVSDDVELLPNITSNTIGVTGNLKAERINGVPWKEFVLKTVRKNVDQTLEFIDIDGNLIIENKADLFIEKLNGLQFPKEYVLKSGPSATIVSGNKTFLGSLVVKAVDIEENVNGLRTLEMVTLDAAQFIPEETVFYDLEVTERLEVKGSIFGKDLDQFMANPNLNQSREIVAACMFSDLIVDGPITIEESLNDMSLSDELSNIVYESEDPVEINSVKTFQNAQFADNLRITSNFLNNINLKNIMMANKEQHVKNNNFKGRIYFGNLNLEGTFNDVNITKLNEDAIKTFGDQFTESELIFEKLDPSQPFVTGQKVKIEESLNGIDVSGFIDHEKDVMLDGKIFFENLSVDSLRGSHIVGPGSFDDLNFKEFEQTRLSKTKPNQKLQGPAHIAVLTSEKNFESQYINGVEMKLLKKYVNNVKNYQDLLLAGNLAISNLIVEGNVYLTQVNGRNLEKLLNNVIWLNRPNIVSNNLRFIEPVEFQKNLTVLGFVNGKNFETFLQNLVSIKEDPIKLWGHKVFLQDLNIEESLTVKQINGIDFGNIWTTNDKEVLEGLNLAGNLEVNSLVVKNVFNSISTNMLRNSYDYISETNTHIVKIDVNFKDQINVNYLQLHQINKANVAHFLDNLVQTNESDFLLSEKQFLKSVKFEHNLRAKFFNDLDLAILKDILRVNEKAPTKVIGDVLFDGIVRNSLIVVNQDLQSRVVSRCDPIEWLRNGIPIDRDIVIQSDMKALSSVFADTNITLNLLNGYPMADLLTIATNQIFNRSLSLDELNVRFPLELRNSLNGFDLGFEHSNTLMNYGDNQVVTARTTFQQGRVLNSLTANHKVNHKNLHQVAQLSNDILIESPISFKSVDIKNLFTEDQISGVNIEDWYDRSVWSQGKDQQTISGKWIVNKGLFKEDVSGNGLINGKNMDEVQKGLEANMAKISTVFQKYQQNYPQLCHEMQNLTNVSHENVHVIKYFENSFVLQADHKIYTLHSLQLKTQHYLLINTGCSSTLYGWQDGKFKKLQEFTTGFVDNWLTISSHHNEVFVVTNTKLENHGCEFGGTNVWKLSGEKCIFHQKIDHEQEVLELHSSPMQKKERFYAMMSDNSVKEFSVYGQKIEEWIMPAGQGYRFVPNDAGYGLAVCDGKMLVRLNSVQQQNEVELKKKRELWPVLSSSAPLILQDNKILKTFAEINEDFKNKTGLGQKPRRLGVINKAGNDANNPNKNRIIPQIPSYSILRPQVAPLPKKQFDDSSDEQEEEEYVDFSSKEFLSKEEKRPLKIIGKRLHENFKAMLKAHQDKKQEMSTLFPALGGSTRRGDEQTTVKPLEEIFKESRENLTQITKGSTEETANDELLTISPDSDIVEQSHKVQTSIMATEDLYKTKDTTKLPEQISENITKSTQKAASEGTTDKPIIKSIIESVTQMFITSTQAPDQITNSSVEVLTDEMELGRKKSFDSSEEDDSEFSKGSFQNIDKHNTIFKVLDTIRDNIEVYLLESPNPNETDIDGKYHSKENSLTVPPSTEVTDPTFKLNIPLTPRFIVNESADQQLNSSKNDQLDDHSVVKSFEQSSTIELGDISSTTSKPVEPSESTENPTFTTDIILNGVHNVTLFVDIENVTTEQPQSSSKSFVTFSANEHISSSNDSDLYTTESLQSTTSQPNKSTTTKVQSLDELLDDVMPNWRVATEMVENENSEQTTEFPEDLEDDRIAQPIPVGGISSANSLYLPALGSGEMVVLNVGPQKRRRTLIGVSSSRQSIIKGNHDVIQIYDDVLEGKLYQTIHCFQPSNLNAIHFRYETLLVFLEGYIDVQVFIFRGIQGFVPFAQFKLSAYAQQMTSLQLPPTLPFKCDRRFLMITTNSDVVFVETKVAGNCGLEENLHCDIY